MKIFNSFFLLGCLVAGQSNAGTFIVETQSRPGIKVSQEEFDTANCYEPGEAVRTEEQTFTVPERGEIFAFSFASLCIQCLPEIEGSLHRVNPDGMLGESLSMVTLDQFIGGSEEPEWIFFQLVEPVMVEAGERFAIRATARSILTSPSDAFDGGELLSDPSRDLTFRVYSIPEPSSTYLILLGGLAISGSRKRTSD